MWIDLLLHLGDKTLQHLFEKWQQALPEAISL
jgi:hypothetical protein